jgi:cytidylate kinase
MKPLIIAIDGPSGAGKGTVARAIASELGYRHVDTGAMYRAVAWKALQEGLDLDEADALAALARRVVMDLERAVVIDGHDVTRAIRTPEIDRAASRVARHVGVREVLVARQRQLGVNGAVVMEGRDIGTVVFPAADVKLYLDADPAERARRRTHDPAHGPARPGGVAEVASAIAARDADDRDRSVSPLATASDAIVIDTTGVPVEEVVRRVMGIVRRKIETGGDPT